ncbi:RNA-binding protein 45 [Chionoecetes opilio]|uniref:RNA-binding protein 45 n=1 Tax=Chionoecetes opilio TaxID=41210 RepID=A0A8J4XZJ0_CHIOP|nr:RNA-binding protein 45 [Chionoecetes opilio]
MSPAFFASAASTPEAAPQPRQTPTPTASSPPILDVTPEAVQPYPKAPPRPAARGRKKIRACILTEDEEALDQLREKEKKKAAREEKKRRSEEKKREKKREQEARQAAKRRRRSEPVEASSSDEEAADNPALCDDSSEYSDEFAEELEHDAATYPFVQKEPEVGDFVLVQLVFKGKRSEELVHFVAKVISLEEDGRLQLDFLRIKSPLLKDTFHFPAIGDVDSVDRSRVLGVLTVSTGTTQRQANLIKLHLATPKLFQGNRVLAWWVILYRLCGAREERGTQQLQCTSNTDGRMTSADKPSRRYDSRDNFHGSDGGKYAKESKYDDPPHSRLFIVCGKSITEEDFRESFSKHGTIEEIWVVKDRTTEEPKGIAGVKKEKKSVNCFARDVQLGA